MYPSLTTYPGDLFAELDALQRQLGRAFSNEWPSSIRAAARGAFPAINMGTTQEAVEIYAFAPGLDPAKLGVNVEKGLLVISGERKGEVPPASDSVTVYAGERFEGRFKRVVGLPEEVDPSRIEATYRNGVLRVVVPKREAMKPRRVEVQAADEQVQKS